MEVVRPVATPGAREGGNSGGGGAGNSNTGVKVEGEPGDINREGARGHHAKAHAAASKGRKMHG